MTTTPWLEEGIACARHVAAAASWSGDACTWRAADAPTALGGDFYEGTAGIAWALARSAAIAGDASVRRAAVGAARHALIWAATTPFRPGFHDGTLGALWAVADASAAVGAGDLLEQATASVERAIASLEAPASGAAVGAGGFDLIHGMAGSLLALVAASDLPCRSPDLVAAVRRLQARVQLTAEPAELGLRWPAKPLPDGTPGPALGLAHGASGAALALLEAARLTGDSAAASTAFDGFLFERASFDARICSWRDPVTGAPLASSWCNGTTGMVLARLRALELRGDPAIASEVGAALAGLHRSVVALGQDRSWASANCSLCHGLLGTADALWSAGDALDHPAHRGAAESVASYAVWLARRLGRWPCGTIDGATSYGLMLGLAGVAATLLRLHAPSGMPPPGLPTWIRITPRHGSHWCSYGPDTEAVTLRPGSRNRSQRVR